jgi:transcriptional regulator with XRE-family HTH domain
MDLAEKANISTNFVSGIERGLQWPYPETLQSLAAALDVKVYELFRPETETGPGIGEYMERFTNDVMIVVQESVGRSLNKVRKLYTVKNGQ